jgi:hypothetical protein
MPELPTEEVAVRPAAVSNDGWLVNHHFFWRLLQPPNDLAAGSRALRPRHYRYVKRLFIFAVRQSLKQLPAKKKKFETAIYFR